MRKTTRQAIALFLGALVLLIGVVQIWISTSGQWGLENVTTRIAQMICGVLMVVVGTYLFAWGVSDEAGKAASSFLRYILDRFLKAFRR